MLMVMMITYTDNVNEGTMREKWCTDNAMIMNDIKNDNGNDILCSNPKSESYCNLMTYFKCHHYHDRRNTSIINPNDLFKNII